MVQCLVALEDAVLPDHLFVNGPFASLPAFGWVAECEAICLIYKKEESIIGSVHV
jgi:hypothetical protein